MTQQALRAPDLQAYISSADAIAAQLHEVALENEVAHYVSNSKQQVPQAVTR